MFGTGVTDRNAVDIDDQISRIIRGLGNPGPPVRLDDVRELLRLDLGYYSATDTGLVRETISRLKVAGRQILARPTILLDAIGNNTSPNGNGTSVNHLRGDIDIASC